MLPWDGTSFASPLVAGSAALLLARNDGLTPRALRARLADGDRPAALSDAVAGGARLNARRALEGIFLSPRSIGPPGGGGRALTGDFDGDGRGDALEAGRRGIRVAFGDREALGDFSLWSPLRAMDSPLAGDVDGDGRDDLVLASRRGIDVAISLGDRFDAPRLFGEGGAPGAMQLADVDGDGRDDVVEARGGDGWLVHRSLGDRLEAPARWSALAAGVPWTIADVNGDGRADLVRLVDEGIGVSLSLGTAFAAEGRSQMDVGLIRGRGARLMSGDVDGDGLSDLALRAADGCWEVALARDRDDGGLWPARPWACGGAMGQETLADLDGDGRADLLRMTPAGGWSILRSTP
jgi:hypothetical protein